MRSHSSLLPRKYLFFVVCISSLIILFEIKTPTLAQTTLTVNTTDDVNDGVCDATHCSLREGIDTANANADLSTISFDIPGIGIRTILPTSPLPTITNPIIVDGTTQPNFTGTPIIELDGSSAGTSANGLVIQGGNSTVRGLIINHFHQTGGGNNGNGIVLAVNSGNTIQGNYIGFDLDSPSQYSTRNDGSGILISTANNLIGGINATDRNVVSNNLDYGIEITGSTAMANTIQGNYLGTTPNGTSALNGSWAGIGIVEAGGGNLIGGTLPGARNIISGNLSGGIFINSSSNNNIQGNFIGTDVSGTLRLANGYGISIAATSSIATNNTIGGLTPEARNLISGNNTGGISIGTWAQENTVVGNYIGTDVTGSQPLGNGASYGAVRIDWVNNTVGGTVPGSGNVIAYNQGIGVYLGYNNAEDNAILGNSIYDNTGLGIDIEVKNKVNRYTPLNFLLISSAQVTGSDITIGGTFKNTANKTFRLEFFSSPTCDSSHSGEGKTYLGFQNVTTNSSGDAIFSGNFAIPVPVTEFITATFTSDTNASSEFSPCFAITELSQSGPTYTVYSVDDTDDGVCGLNHCSLREAINAANLNMDTSTVAFNIPFDGVQTIHLTSALPTITAPIIIDAIGQDSVLYNRPSVELDGTNAGVANGLHITAGNSTIKRLVINRFMGAGILLQTGGGNTISGNFIGVSGDQLQALGNHADGIEILDSANNVIGTAATIPNMIAGNHGNGISIRGAGSTGNVIRGNYIGQTTYSFLGNQGNGIKISGASENNIIGDGSSNTITSNIGAGILIEANVGGGTGNRISGNMIYVNGGLGIDLNGDGVTQNDLSDSDSGANNLQNFPTISQADRHDSILTFRGTFNSSPNTTYRLAFYGLDSCDETGYGEGAWYQGYMDVTTNDSGDATFTFKPSSSLQIGQFVTALSTDPSGNTSEFSACQVIIPTPDSVQAGPTFTVTTNSNSDDGTCSVLNCSLREALTAANVNSDLSTVAFDIIGSGVRTIQVATALPTITSPIIIDGTTQPNYAGTPLIEFDGRLAGTTTDGLHIIAGNSTVKGIVIDRFGGAGIFLETGGNNTITANYVGTDTSFSLTRGNRDGIYVLNSSNNRIGGTNAADRNVIVGNTQRGVKLLGTTTVGNQILSNLIYNNTVIGLDLNGDGRTPNDSNDADTGANNLQNYPELDWVISQGNTAQIIGKLNSTPSTSFRLEFFRVQNCASQSNAQGSAFLDAASVTTNASGRAEFSLTISALVTPYQNVTATATDSSGNTSEFAGCTQVAPSPSGFPQPGPTFTVNTLTDTDDGICGDRHCSLREAINAANNIPELNTINFNIAGSSTRTIQLLVPLPPITDLVTIDGTSQPDFAGNPLIELDGSNMSAGMGFGYGLTISAGNSTVQGLVINHFEENGIILDTNGNNVIQGNYIGVDATGTQARGNGNPMFPNADGYGIKITSNGNTIGGLTPPARNVISANVQGGIAVFGDNNVIRGNYIGTNASGTSALANKIGILLFGNGNIVGGTTPAARNTISGNVIGMNIGRSNNIVQGNYIGADASGAQPLGNTIIGIDISGDVTNIANNNLVGGTVSGAGNVIAYNGSPGMGIRGIPGTATGNAILGNRIFANGTLGIDLEPEGLTPNDSGDNDTGPNNLQNFPVLTSAGLLSNTLNVGGSLNSTPNTSFRIEFFANPTCDSSGNGEGQTFLGFANMLTDNDGNLNFSVALPAINPGQFISATATDTNSNTSEFSACVPVLITSLPAASPSTNYFTSLTVALTWGPVSWAAGYQIEVDDQPDFLTPVYQNLNITLNPLVETFSLDAEGDYYWRVRAVRPDGEPGTWSSINTFTIRLH